MAEGIMVRRETRLHKFLSISTKGNRVLKDIVTLKSIKELINLAYKEGE
ncbi:hypothetical protein QUF86_20090 [Peribacillus sp. NJ11]|nr:MULTISPECIES: hypothetical protein [Peribacillus]MDM5222997.1 hypothetical protein [Peribacillus sp. NJ11]